MKIVIGYPPLESEKGIPQVSQNRQFQWTMGGSLAYSIYPVVPASAATLLKKNGHEIYWADGVAEKTDYQKWLHNIQKFSPDLVFLEVKTPVIKKYWQVITDIKKICKTNCVLGGDHVTALPKESFQHSQVDYIIQGGHYDFLLLNLVNHLAKNEKLDSGILTKKNRNSIPLSILHYDLNNLPIIDRELTKWQLYAYKNSNFYRAPGAYTMFGRDCWWGRCSFCFTGDTQIYTANGLVSIKKIVDTKETCKVLTAESSYRKVTDWHKRFIDEEIKKISTLYLPYELKITQNHNVYFLAKDSLTHCFQRNGWAYLCKPDRISKFLECDRCKNKYFLNYKISFTKAENLKKGDFLAIPINRTVKNLKQIKIEEVIKRQPTILKTTRKIPQDTINQIISLKSSGYSEGIISKKLKITRETVHRYLLLKKNDSEKISINRLSYDDNNNISFLGGHHKISCFIKIDKDFLLVSGFYIAEGHISYNRHRPNSATLGITFNRKETDFINKTKLFFKKTFRITLSETVNLKNHTIQLCIGSTIISKFFNILFGSNSYNKIIPPEFIHLNINKQRYLLEGIFKGDGHLRKKRNNGGSEYILETSSKILSEQVFTMLLRFNVVPGYKVIKPRHKNESIQYKISLFTQDIIKVFPNIKYRIDNSKVTYKKGFILDNFALLPIVQITKEHFRGFVYNLTVEDEHSYTANFLAVKNCSWTTLFPGKNYRVVSVKNAIKEIENLVENYQIKEIMDDSGTFPTGAWLTEFCEEIIKRGYQQKIRINCNMRFNSTLTQKDYNLMGKAGFRFILYGLESANQKTLDKINKNLKVSQIEKSLTMAKKAGLWPHITVMIGYPWESENDIKNTVSFVKNLFQKGLVDSMQATIVIPYPGTPLFEECKKNNWLKTTDWDKYDMRGPVMKTKVSEEKLLSFIRELYSVSIWNKTFIISTMKQLNNWDGLKYVSFQGIKYFGKLLEFRK